MLGQERRALRAARGWAQGITNGLEDAFVPRRQKTFSADELGDPLWPIARVAALLSVDHKTIRRWVARGMFPVPMRLVGNARRWRRSTINAWIAEREGQVK